MRAFLGLAGVVVALSVLFFGSIYMLNSSSEKSYMIVDSPEIGNTTIEAEEAFDGYEESIVDKNVAVYDFNTLAAPSLGEEYYIEGRESEGKKFTADIIKEYELEESVCVELYFTNYNDEEPLFRPRGDLIDLDYICELGMDNEFRFGAMGGYDDYSTIRNFENESVGALLDMSFFNKTKYDEWLKNDFDTEEEYQEYLQEIEDWENRTGNYTIDDIDYPASTCITEDYYTPYKSVLDLGNGVTRVQNPGELAFYINWSANYLNNFNEENADNLYYSYINSESIGEIETKNFLDCYDSVKSEIEKYNINPTGGSYEMNYSDIYDDYGEEIFDIANKLIENGYDFYKVDESTGIEKNIFGDEYVIDIVLETQKDDIKWADDMISEMK